MSVFKKTLLYLGLGPDEEYEYDAVQQFAPEAESETVRPLTPSGGSSVSSNGPTVRPVPMDTAPLEPATRSSHGDAGSAAIIPQPIRPSGSSGGAVRPIPMETASKPSTVAPISFNDAQEIADHFKSNKAVIVNLQNVERDLSRRIIDFASGICYGLGGQMERVAKDVYLLTPDDVVVNDDDRRLMID